MFWRNVNTRSLAAPEADEALGNWYRELRAAGSDALASAAGAFVAVAIHGAHRATRQGRRWLPQDLGHAGHVAKATLVLAGTERPALGSVVGAGVSLWLDTRDGLAGEVGLYLHRLVCASGMVFTSDARGRFAAATPQEWVRQIEAILPFVIDDVEAGFELLRTTGTAVTALAPESVPGCLARWMTDESVSGLVSRAFQQEPGYAWAGLGNALARAANLAMDGRGGSLEDDLRLRYRLQCAAGMAFASAARGEAAAADPFDQPSAASGAQPTHTDTPSRRS